MPEGQPREPYRIEASITEVRNDLTELADMLAEHQRYTAELGEELTDYEDEKKTLEGIRDLNESVRESLLELLRDEDIDQDNLRRELAKITERLSQIRKETEKLEEDMARLKKSGGDYAAQHAKITQYSERFKRVLDQYMEEMKQVAAAMPKN